MEEKGRGENLVVGTREDVIMLTAKCQGALKKTSTKGDE